MPAGRSPDPNPNPHPHPHPISSKPLTLTLTLTLILTLALPLADRGGGSAEAAELGVGRTEWVAMQVARGFWLLGPNPSPNPSPSPNPNQASADSMRGLVRIKIADDNDIKAARCALETCRDFFDALEQLAALRRLPAFDTMQSLL